MDFRSELRREKVRKYEEFVDRRLKPDLVDAIAQRDKVFQQQKVLYPLNRQIQTWTYPSPQIVLLTVFFSSDLKRNIQTLEQNGATSLRTMVNLGSEVYMQADVADTRHVFVDIGLGFYVEFTWAEALEFIPVREARLARQIEEYTHLIASIKARIKLVCEGIRELLEIPAQ